MNTVIVEVGGIKFDAMHLVLGALFGAYVLAKGSV